jgi:hypothetical protein
MFLNYYMEFISDQRIKIGAMKILGLFLKFDNIGMKLYHVYGRVFYNLLRSLEVDEKEDEHKLAYKSIFLMYSKLPNSTFVR